MKKGMETMAFNFNRLTVKAQEIVQSAIEIAQNYNNQIAEPEHILAAIVQESGNIAETIIKKTGGNINAIKIKINELPEKLPKVSGTGLGNQQMSGALAKLLIMPPMKQKILKMNMFHRTLVTCALANGSGKSRTTFKRQWNNL